MTESEDLTPKKKASLEWRRGFAERYERARVEAGLTYEEIGKRLNVSKSLTHHWAMSLSEITPPQLVKLANVLRVDQGWLLSGRGHARAPTYHLTLQQLAADQEIIADTVQVDIVDNSVNGLAVGDEAVFNRHRPPEPGDVTLVVLRDRPALVGRFVSPSTSTFQLATDDDKGPHVVELSEVTWRGVLSRRTKYGSR
jgi:transcriptional regulator with XRE-family HTH domain